MTVLRENSTAAKWTHGAEARRKGTHWRGSYIRKIVRSNAPIGLFTPSKTTRDEETRARRDVPLDPVALFPGRTVMMRKSIGE